jgi:hypothetical protein
MNSELRGMARHLHGMETELGAVRSDIRTMAHKIVRAKLLF